MFTNVGSPLCYNFCEDTVPTSLQDALRFQIDNPFVLQKKLEVDSSMNESGMELRKVVKAAERDALETIVELFDWLDGLEPLTANKISLTARPAAKETMNPAVSLSPCLHHARVLCSLNDVDPLSRFQKVICVQASKPKPVSNYKNLCIFVSDFYSTCSMRLHPTWVLVVILFPWVQLFLCSGLIL